MTKICKRTKNKLSLHAKFSRMLDRFKKFLLSSNIDFVSDNEIISFKYEDYVFYFISDKSDPYYFRLILPNAATIQDGKKQQMQDIINKKNREVKAAKATIHNDEVWVSVEQFAFSMEAINLLFKKSILVLLTFVVQLNDELKRS